MRAVDIILFLFFINLGIGVASYVLAGGLYGGTNPIGMTPSGAEEAGENIKIPGSPGHGLGGIINPFKNIWNTISIVIGSFVITALAAGFFGAPVLQALPLALFGALFWLMWDISSGIMDKMLQNVSGLNWLVEVITIIFAGLFLIAIMEFSSGRTLRRYE